MLVAGVLAIIGWFFYFGAQGLRGGFSPDDPMNLYYAYAAGPWKVIKGNLMFWSSFYRPLGSGLYLAVFSMFGLDPFYFRLVFLCTLVLAIPAAFLAARRLTQHDGIAWIAAFLTSYNIGLNSLVFSTAFVYDALAALFYLAALAVYLEPRQRSEPLTRRRTIAVILLYICALNSKEMTVSLPVMLLLYEAAIHPPEWRSWRSIRGWLSKPALVPLAAGAITALYIIGKSIGPDALSSSGGYQQVFTWRRFMESQANFLGIMFASLQALVNFNFARTLQTWSLVAYYAWRTRRPVLFLLASWVIITPLPVTFIEGRGGGCLYIPWFGWALIIAIVAWDVVSFLSRDRLFHGVPRRSDQALLSCLFVVIAGQNTFDLHRRHFDSWKYTGEQTMHLLQQFRELDFRPHAKERLVFLDNPPGNFDLAFIASLYWRNPKLHLLLNDKTPQSKEDLDRADYLIGYKDGRFVVHKRPQASIPPGAARL